MSSGAVKKRDWVIMTGWGVVKEIKAVAGSPPRKVVIVIKVEGDGTWHQWKS